MLHSKFPFPLLGPEAVEEMSIPKPGFNADLERIAQDPALNQSLWNDLLFLAESMFLASETGLTLCPGTSRAQ